MDLTSRTPDASRRPSIDKLRYRTFCVSRRRSGFDSMNAHLHRQNPRAQDPTGTASTSAASARRYRRRRHAHTASVAATLLSPIIAPVVGNPAGELNYFENNGILRRRATDRT